jgi:signal peptidase I
LALSDPFKQPQEQNRPEDSAPPSADEAEESANSPSEMPLPDFDPVGPEDHAAESSALGSTDLAEFLATQRQPEERSGDRSAPAKQVYQVSPAEPDWSDYTLPPLPDSEPASPTGTNWKTTWAVLREVGETIILTLIIFLLIQTVIRNFRVVGTSMVDNLHDGQYLIIDKLSYNPLLTNVIGLGGPQRGDVIVFEPPNRPTEDYVKRIVGLPGETVEIKNSQVFINGQPLDQPYLPGTPSYTMPPRVVPEGHVFVLGDNRNNSNDSHNWGPLPVENIVGRAWLSYWPPDEWGTISRNSPTEETTLRYFLSELVPSANAESE